MSARQYQPRVALALAIMLTLVILAAPLAAEAQEAAQSSRIGILDHSTPAAFGEFWFGNRLADLGYVEGQNMGVEYRYARGKAELYPALVAAQRVIVPSPGPGPTIIQLVPPHAVVTSSVYGINSPGHVVGSAQVSLLPLRGYFWRDSSPIEIGVGGEQDVSEALAVDDNDEIVGYIHAANPAQGAIPETAFGLLQEGFRLLFPGRAYAINKWGNVVGYTLDCRTCAHRAVFWPSGPILPDFFVSSEATGINDANHVVGTIYGSGWSNAFMWNRARNTYTNLGTLGGTNSVGRAINNYDQIVGASDTAGGAQHAFMWQNGVMSDLGTLPGGLRSDAVSINLGGQVVGYSEDANGRRPVIWQNGVIHDLNDLLPAKSGWVLSTAVGINDHGQVVGKGSLNGLPLAYVLTLYRPPVVVP